MKREHLLAGTNPILPAAEPKSGTIQGMSIAWHRSPGRVCGLSQLQDMAILISTTYYWGPLCALVPASSMRRGWPRASGTGHPLHDPTGAVERDGPQEPQNNYNV